MPYKDPAMKIEAMKKWRKRSIANGYGKWLYDRRALRFADREYFLQALLNIERTTDDPSSAQIVRVALEASEKRWEALGPSPAPGAAVTD